MPEPEIAAVVGRDEQGRLVELESAVVGPDDELCLVDVPAGVVAVIGPVDPAELDELAELLKPRLG